MKHTEEVEQLDPHWPKWKYHQSGKSKLIGSKREEDYLGSAWKDSPAEHGVITHPHSDEYLAKMAIDDEDAVLPEATEGEEIPHEKKAHKARKHKSKE